MTVDKSHDTTDYMLRLEAAINEIIGLTETGKFWFLATPYSDYDPGPQRAFVDAARMAGSLLAIRIAVYTPVVHGHPLLNVATVHPLAQSDEARIAMWSALNKPFAEHAIGLIVAELPGWQESMTVRSALDFFTSAAKPIVNLPVDYVQL